MPGHCIPWRFLVLLCFWGTWVQPGPAQETVPAEVKWRYDYNLARKEALAKKLPILIDFGTRDCFFCVKLDQTTFRDPRVAGVMNEQFIPLKIDAQVDVQLTQMLNVQSYPTLVMGTYDGKILHTIVGYQEAPIFLENLRRVLASVTEPDWMVRDYQLAYKLIQNKEYGRAITGLRNIVEDGKNRPVQVAAQKLLQELEKTAQERLVRAKEMFERGQSAEAVEAVNDTLRVFPGLQAARDGTDLLSRFAVAPDLRQQQRSKRAQELLAQAQEFYKLKDYIPCLDRCEILVASYGDLNEGQEASQLSANIKSDPEWLQSACEVMGDRLSNLYLSLADSLLRKGQPDRARFYLDRVVRSFPGTRQAESAQIRLGQLAGMPSRRPADVDAASNKD